MLSEVVGLDDEIIKDVELLHPDGKKYLTNRVESVKEDIRKYLDRDTINNILAKDGSAKERMLLMLLWRSGIRVTEAISIKRSDIDFSNLTIKVRWQKSRKYLNRIVPVQKGLIDVLNVFVAGLNQEDLLFPYSRQRAWQIVRKWCGSGVSPHTFRHSFAVNWLRQKGDIVVLHRILGHSKVQTTMEYLKIVPQDQAKELEKIVF